MIRYFAYGSNLKLSRMRERVPSAHALGPACLAGYRLTLDKLGADGSAKANVREDAEAHVWGVVYRVEPGAWPDLDTFERGYARRLVTVERSGGERLDATTYASQRLTADTVAFDWYKRLILEGAREHGLPESWLAALERLTARPDSRG